MCMRMSDPLPSDEQRRMLCDMLHDALNEIRIVSGGGRRVGDAKQAHDLAYAFHNLPKTMYGWGTWSIAGQRAMLRHYQDKYPGGLDYVGRWDAIFGTSGGAE